MEILFETHLKCYNEIVLLKKIIINLQVNNIV